MKDALVAHAQLLEAELKRKGGVTTMFTQLKNMQLERTEIDELMALATFADAMLLKYDEKGIDVPEWLADRASSLDREIIERNRDKVESEIKRAEAQLEAMKSPGEKRDDLKARISRLKKQLVAK